MPRRADLKTGYNCNSNCVFCVIGDKLFTGDRTTADCIEELKLSRQTCEDVVFTGAEVTLRQDFFHLVRAARTLGYRNIQIQTNGRMFAYEEFCKKAIAAGANEFSPSIHGHLPKLHDGLTRSQGSFVQITAAIKNLKALGQRVVTNTVATRQNMKHLPDLAAMLVGLKVDQFQIAYPHPTGHAETYFNAVVPRMAELAPWVHRALQVGIDANVSCMAEAMPFCTMQGYERYVSELFIPPTEIVYDGFVVPDYRYDRMERGKTRFPQCATCRYEPICEGPWREYPEHAGSAEFQPVTGARVIDPELVLDDRFALLGTPAPKLPLETDAKWIALVFYPEDGSPDCTAQACSVQRGLGTLREASVAVFGVSPDSLESHAAFAKSNGLEFPLLSDAGGALAAQLKTRSRATVLIGPGRTVDHVILAPDLGRHAEQILSAIRRFEAPARPLERGPEQVVVRRAKPAAAAVAELGLQPDDPEQFTDA